MSEKAEATQFRVLVVMPEHGTTRELLAYLEQRGLQVLWVREGPSAFDILDADPPVDALTPFVICAMNASMACG